MHWMLVDLNLNALGPRRQILYRIDKMFKKKETRTMLLPCIVASTVTYVFKNALILGPER